MSNISIASDSSPSPLIPIECTPFLLAFLPRISGAVVPPNFLRRLPIALRITRLAFTTIIALVH